MSASRPFFRPLDGLLLALVAVASAWGFTHFRVSAGGKAEIFVDGSHYGWYGLQGPDREVKVPTAIGTVRLRIGGGSAQVLSSPCRNKVCVRMGRASHAHSELVCMPARLLVLIASADPVPGTKETDAVTW